ncbi:MAG: hypothetical protein MR902_02250 [Campylobacter sp.]|nr:hypothetical protein [Campylobacter sp.]
MRKIYKICLVLLIFACYLRADNGEEFALSLENSFDFLKIEKARSDQGIFDYDGKIEGSIKASAINDLFAKFGIDSNLSDDLSFKYSYNIKNSLSTAFGRSNIDGVFIINNEPYKSWLAGKNLFSLKSRTNSSYHNLELEFSDINATFNDANLNIQGLNLSLSVNDELQNLNQILLNSNKINYNLLNLNSIHINSTYDPPLGIALSGLSSPTLFVLNIGEISDQNLTIQNLTITNNNLEIFDKNGSEFNATFVSNDANQSDLNASLKISNFKEFTKILSKSDTNETGQFYLNSNNKNFCFLNLCFKQKN